MICETDLWPPRYRRYPGRSTLAPAIARCVGLALFSRATSATASKHDEKNEHEIP